MRRSLLFGLSLLAGVMIGRGDAAEVQETYRDAYKAYLEGRFEEAAGAYRYLDTLGVDGVAPTINLAIVERDAGDPDTALPLWTKASLLDPTNAFVWNQRGWCYLSMQRYKQARASFHQAIEVSSSTAWSAEANFGLGMTEALDDDLKAAVTAFQETSIPSPYLIPATATWLGRLAIRMKRWPEAELYLEQSVHVDPIQPEVFRELGDAYRKGDSPKAAWLAYKSALDMNPVDGAAQEGLREMARVIPERTDKLIPARRIGGPMLRRFGPTLPGDLHNAIRVGLYSNTAGVPAFMRRFFFMSGSDFKIVDSRLGEVSRGNAGEEWEAKIGGDTGVIELRDVHGQLQYTTKQPFRIEPSSSGASVLIKSPEFADITGVDVGDLEVRGIVEAVPTPLGLQLVNEVGVEQYLFGQVAAVMPAGSPPEALKAQAVVSRTQVEWLRRHAAPDPVLHTITCDSKHCGVYTGLAMESLEATQSVLDSQGVMLMQGGQPIEVHEHAYSDPATEDGALDADARQSPATAYELERLIHSFPDKDLYNEASSLVPPSWARWARVFDADTLRSRLVPDHDVGRLHQISVTRRSPMGRAEALAVTGSHGRFDVEGDAAIQAFLSPGGLRSMNFVLQPFYEGRALSRLVVWGLGTGDGRGLCIAGALGMAAKGRNAKEILEHYFPGIVVQGLKEPPPPAPPADFRAIGQANSTEANPQTPEERLRERGKRARALREKLRARAHAARHAEDAQPAQEKP